jgi:hypothetical protein
LADKPLSLEEICAAKNLARRPAHALLAVATAPGFLCLTDGRHTLPPLAEDYLLEDSPTYFGGAFDGMLGIYSVYPPTFLKQAVLPFNHWISRWMVTGRGIDRTEADDL